MGKQDDRYYADEARGSIVPNVEVDLWRLRRYSDDFREGLHAIMTLAAIAIAVLLVLFVGAMAVAAYVSTVLGLLLGALLFLAGLAVVGGVGVLLATIRSRKSKAYREVLMLSVGQVVRTEPFAVLVATDLSMGQNPSTDIYGVRLQTFKELPDQDASLGSLVPVAFHYDCYDFDITDQVRWKVFTANPICWVTGDRQELSRCEREVREQDPEIIELIATLAANNDAIGRLDDDTMLLLDGDFEITGTERIERAS